MNVSTELNLRSEAARIGFFKKSLVELTGIIKHNIKESFKADEKKLEVKLLRCKQKSINSKNQMETLELRYEQSPFNVNKFIVGILCIGLVIVLIQTGKIVSGIFGPLLIGLGFIGCLIISLHDTEKPVWRPILFITLSVLGGIIIYTALRDNDKGFALSMLSGLITGLNIYILNSSIIKSFQFLFKQTKAMITACRAFIYACLFRFWTIKEKETNQRLEVLTMQMEIAYNKNKSLVELEYLIGETAREIKGIKSNGHLLQRSNEKKYTYAS